MWSWPMHPQTDDDKRRQLRILRQAALELIRQANEMLERAARLETGWWPVAAEVEKQR